MGEVLKKYNAEKYCSYHGIMADIICNFVGSFATDDELLIFIYAF